MASDKNGKCDIRTQVSLRSGCFYKTVFEEKEKLKRAAKPRLQNESTSEAIHEGIWERKRKKQLLNVGHRIGSGLPSILETLISLMYYIGLFESRVLNIN